MEAVVERSYRPPFIRMMMALSFEVRYLRLAGIEAVELFQRGYSDAVLLAAGFRDVHLLIAETQPASSIPHPRPVMSSGVFLNHFEP